jgi:hypothetical protein
MRQHVLDDGGRPLPVLADLLQVLLEPNQNFPLQPGVAAAVGLLAVVAVRLGLEVLVEPGAWLVAAVALVLLWRGVPSPLLIAVGAAFGVARVVLGP